MSHELIKEQFAQRAPFFGTLGMVLDHVGDGVARARLENRKEIANHLGTLHAGAMFTLGEGTSGAAVMGAFADRAEDIRAVSTKASIDYITMSRGLTTCEAQVTEPIDILRQRLDDTGQTDCHVEVTLKTASGKDVASMSVSWLVFKRNQKTGA